MLYDEMLNYVYQLLSNNDALRSPKKNHGFRNRYEHIKRVLKWANIISKGVDRVNNDVLFTACIFHDAGYAYGKENHALSSGLIFKEYAKNKNFSSDFIASVLYCIENHSNKDLLKKPNQPIELILLLEADLLDEEGCMGIVWDLLAVGADNPNDYKDALEAINIHSAHILNQDYMVTPISKKIWAEKKNIVKEFINSLKKDLFISEVWYDR